MRRFFFVIFLVALSFASFRGWRYLSVPISPCDSPLSYRLGQLDPRFNIGKVQAEKDIAQAAEIWNKVTSKKIFKQDSQAKLTINFIYDERQALSTKIGSQENNLNTDKRTLDSQIADFLKQKADFESKINALNQEITDWNQKGGAPSDVYRQIQEQSQSLRSQGEKLQNLAGALNQKTGSYNYEVKLLNGTVNDFNAVISQKPEEGLYNGAAGTIYIYLNSSQKILIHTLAHELGHALGMSHTTDPNAIMYVYTSANLLPTAADRAELVRACKPKSRLEILVPMIKERLKMLSTKLVLR